MTTMLDTITDALIKCRVLGAGRTPKAQDAADGLKVLEDLFNHLDGYGAAHPYQDVYADAAFQISRDDPSLRVHAQTGSGAFTVTLPAKPRDGARLQVIDSEATFDSFNLTIDSQGILFDATLTGAGALSGGQRTALALSTEGLNRTWMYRADLGAWVRLTGLTLASAMPYPTDFDRSFGYMLAVELADLYGVELSNVQLRHADIGYERLAARYVEPLPVTLDRAILPRRTSGRGIDNV